MKEVTLDTNCIYDLETNQTSAVSIRKLIWAHDCGAIRLRVPAISASEIQRGGGSLDDFQLFKQRLAACGLGSAEILLPIGYIDVTYIEHSVICDDEMLAHEAKIHNVLFPNVPFAAGAFYESRGDDRSDPRLHREWINKKCDVQAMWCHIHYSGDAFVTSDTNFHKHTKKPRLKALGAGEILTPDVAASRFG